MGRANYFKSTREVYQKRNASADYRNRPLGIILKSDGVGVQAAVADMGFRNAVATNVLSARVRLTKLPRDGLKSLFMSILPVKYLPHVVGSGGTTELHFDVRCRGFCGIQFGVDAVLLENFGAVVVGVLQENAQAFHFRVIGLLHRFVDGAFE